MTNPTRKLGFALSFLTVLGAIWNSTQVAEVVVAASAARTSLAQRPGQLPLLDLATVVDPFDPDHRGAGAGAAAGDAAAAAPGTSAEATAAVRRILVAGPLRFASCTVGLLRQGQERGGLTVLRIGPGEVQVSIGGRHVACSPVVEEPLVRGVLIDRGSRAAIIDGRVVPVGSTHEDIRVVSVDLDHVKLWVGHELVSCKLPRPSAGRRTS